MRSSRGNKGQLCDRTFILPQSILQAVQGGQRESVAAGRALLAAALRTQGAPQDPTRGPTAGGVASAASCAGVDAPGRGAAGARDATAPAGPNGLALHVAPEYGHEAAGGSGIAHGWSGAWGGFAGVPALPSFFGEPAGDGPQPFHHQSVDQEIRRVLHQMTQTERMTQT